MATILSPLFFSLSYLPPPPPLGSPSRFRLVASAWRRRIEGGKAEIIKFINRSCPMRIRLMRTRFNRWLSRKSITELYAAHSTLSAVIDFSPIWPMAATSPRAGEPFHLNYSSFGFRKFGQRTAGIVGRGQRGGRARSRSHMKGRWIPRTRTTEAIAKVLRYRNTCFYTKAKRNRVKSRARRLCTPGYE